MILLQKLNKLEEKINQIRRATKFIDALQQTDETVQYLSVVLFEASLDYTTQLRTYIEKEQKPDFVEVQVSFVLPFLVKEILKCHQHLTMPISDNEIKTKRLYEIKAYFQSVIAQFQSVDSAIDETLAKKRFEACFPHHVRDEETIPVELYFSEAYKRRLAQVFSGKEYLIELFEGITNRLSAVFEAAVKEHKDKLFDLDFLHNNEHFHPLICSDERFGKEQFGQLKREEFFKTLPFVRKLEIASLFNRRFDFGINIRLAKLSTDEFSYLLKSLISQGDVYFVEQLLNSFSGQYPQSFLYKENAIEIDFCSWAALFGQDEILALLFKRGFAAISHQELLFYIAAGGSPECFKLTEFSAISNQELQQATLITLAKGHFALYRELTALLTAREITMFANSFYQPAFSPVFHISAHLNYVFAVYQNGHEWFLRYSQLAHANVVTFLENVIEQSITTQQDVVNFLRELLITAAKSKNEKMIEHAFQVFFELEKKYPFILKVLSDEQVLFYEYLAENIARKVLDFSEKQQRTYLKALSLQGLDEFQHALVSIQREVDLKKLKSIFQLVHERLFGTNEQNIIPEKKMVKDHYRLLAALNLMMVNTPKKIARKEVEKSEPTDFSQFSSLKITPQQN